MAAYRRVYDSRHVQADCQEPGSAPEPYAWQSSMGYTFTCLFGRVSGESRQTAAWPSLPSVGRDLAGGCAREKDADGDTVSTAQFHHGPTTGWTVKSAGRGGRQDLLACNVVGGGGGVVGDAVVAARRSVLSCPVRVLSGSGRRCSEWRR